ncbi:AAA family ATPase [Arthrobacter sp. NicSoilB8]|uniref:AAA family ATPase n=1 Tax=Arthrobacter sp. NicSoilB8 TaxID=2830998 RepID=UPI001CC7EB63|nr:AAA family ATPase [Arthrobacter sp. NicSoilB8]BCW70676.1 hypothetical protein NicSoilB8_17200 [Arthrobacter sp. NicSoilB8]
MRIECVEIQNFRKLAAVRIDFAENSTLLVGANNSGKTTALVALRHFLVDGAGAFRATDITLSKWSEINAIGEEWLAKGSGPLEASADVWRTVLPSLDVWLRVENHEIHQVSALLPTLDWSGGLLGVRIALEPTDVEALYGDFRAAWERSRELLNAASQGSGLDGASEGNTGLVENAGATTTSFTLWPESLLDYLSRGGGQNFVLRHYVLDPSRLEPATRDLAAPQLLPHNAAPLIGDPLRHLIRIDEINAQRGLGEVSSPSSSHAKSATAEGAKLSRQLSDYYVRHLSPSEHPDVSDIHALDTISIAQREFDKRLAEAFKQAITEMEGLGYPGVSDPRIRIASKLSATDSLNHDSAVSFLVDVAGVDSEPGPQLHLPESHNGLGYQNLISMVFRLMSFRDAWMRVGKAGRTRTDVHIEPLHLVLIEEPEAHLHVQVQQVFAKKAFDVLRNHPDLKEKTQLTTQLVVSTHSSHVSHELPFSSLRYFRRLPAGSQSSVPTSAVISLKDVFGAEDKTEHFVTRYLRAHHADLFFADAVILVEGPAERMLLPNFIRNSHAFLNSAYITILEIGGSHAHRLKPLIEALQIPTLVVTDIDALKEGKGVPVKRGQGQETGNPTLKDWAPVGKAIDDLLDAADDMKSIEGDELFAVRFAYQTPVKVAIPSDAPSEEALPSTFEDSLAFENVQFFSELPGVGLTKKFRVALSEGQNPDAVAEALFTSLKSGKKAEFALDIISDIGFKDIQVPGYISAGLYWLEARLRKQAQAVGEIVVPSAEDHVDG